MSRRTQPVIRMPRWLAIFLVSLAGLLLEVGYTRIVSYKLWYYYTYLVIGLALLGIGSGSVFVAVFQPVRRWATDRIIASRVDPGAVSIAIGYLVVAASHDQHDRDLGLRHPGVLHEPAAARRHLLHDLRGLHRVRRDRLGTPRAGGRRRRSDLLRRSPGRGLGCLLAIPLITRLGPPRVIMLAALVFAVVGLLSCLAARRCCSASRASRAIVLIITVVGAGVLPDVRTEDSKLHTPRSLVLRRGARCSASTSCSFKRHVELPARARRHVRLRHPAVQRRSGRSRTTTRRTRVRSRSRCSASRRSTS